MNQKAAPQAPPRSGGFQIRHANRGVMLASVLGVLALGVIAASARDGQGAVAGAIGLNAAAEAAALPIGAARDRKLADAQEWLSRAISISGPSAALWGALAETRYHQATGAEVRSVSPALLTASLEAARESVALAPADARAQARLAASLSAIEGRQQEAAAALAHSYRLMPLSATLAPLRVEAAGRVYARLDARAQMDARGEACMAYRTGAAVAPAFAAITRDPGCARSPGSSPQGQ